MKNAVIDHGEYLELDTFQRVSFLIDKDDYERVKDYKWYAYKKRPTSNYYVCADKTINKTKIKISLHRYINGCVKGDSVIVDHINGNTLDNRKSNLRRATKEQNQRNCKTQYNSLSGRKGVRKHKLCDKWQARITVNNREIYLGLHSTFEEACKAREKAEDKYFGEFKSYEFNKRTN